MEYRFYKHWKTAWRQNTFIGLRTEWKQSFLKGEGTFSRQNGSYQEILPYHSVTNTNNVFFIHGWMKRLGEHWAVETKLGYGVRFVHLMHKDIPEDARLLDNRNEFFNVILRNPRRYNLINGLFRFKIIYLLK